MTDRRAADPFETRLAGRARTYAEVAVNRPFDALRVARTAISSERARGWRIGPVGAGRPRLAAVAWVVVLAAIVLVGVLGTGVLSGPPMMPSPSSGPTGDGTVPDALRHAWQRPSPIFPGLDKWGSGSLALTATRADYGSDPISTLSSTTAKVVGADTLVVIATTQSQGCTIGDRGSYRWLLEGKGSVLTLTAIGADACAARGQALAGQWVRADFPPVSAGLPPGTYLTSTFDPLGDSAAPMRLAYTIPEGWDVIEDVVVTFVRPELPQPSAGEPPDDTIITVMDRPKVPAALEAGADCTTPGDKPGVGVGLDSLMAAIISLPGVVATAPQVVTIAGYDARLVDLHLEPSWTSGCTGPAGPIVVVPVLHEGAPAQGPLIALAPDQPLRVILVRLTAERTMVIAISDTSPSTPALSEAHRASAMRIVETFELQVPRQ